MLQLLTLLPMLAVTLNPGTGDRNRTFMIIVIAALIISAALIIWLVVSSKKKK